MRDSEHNLSGFGVDAGLPGCLTWDISQLANGQVEVLRNAVPFDSAWIGSVAVDRSALHQIRTRVGWGAVLLPATESGPVYFEGRRLVAGDAVLLPSDTHLELLTHGLGHVYLIAYQGAAGSRARVRRPRWYTRAHGRAGAGLLEDLRSWMARPNPGDIYAESAVQMRMLVWLRETMADAEHPDDEVPALPRRRLAVERVRRFIHEHLAESLTLAELCQQAHLQARSLEYGFRDLVGLSPFKYIKMLRLGEVRRRLQASTAAERSVSEVALDCGFCHLSQFAADYKRVFLESPSATQRAIARSRPSRVAHYDAGPAAFATR